MGRIFGVVFGIMSALCVGFFVYLYHQGNHLSLTFPFVWRESDQHPSVQATCITLMTLGVAIKGALEQNIDLGPFVSVEETARILKKHHLIEGSDPLTKDHWGNRLKIKSKFKDNKRTILIFSDTRNEFPVSEEGFNLFVRLVIESNGNVSVTGSMIRENGRLVTKKQGR